MSIKSISLLLLSLAFLSACLSNSNTTSSDNTLQVKPDSQRIRAHMNLLADDVLEGRETGSAGHEMASLYIQSAFEQYGLLPAGDNGSYLQRITFRQAFLDQSSPQLTFKSQDKEISLTYPKDFIAYANMSDEEAVLDAELVFAGYGIIAPELGHDDYADLDVAGKVVIVLHGKPVQFPSEEGAHFGSSKQKDRNAVAKGAIGMITISTPLAEKVRPYQNLLNFLHIPKMRFLDSDGKPVDAFPQIQNTAYLSQPAARQLFAGEQLDLDGIYSLLEQGKTPKGFALKPKVHLSTKSTFNTVTSPNVAAILPGSDPQLKQEYVLYSAHSDHIGFAKSVLQDKINNGAMDNASGTAVMLETARLFSQAAQKPKRSILFVAVTGEEKGLLGSQYFAQHPTVPIDSIVANVNLDMPILTYEFADVIAFGANHSDMQQSVSIAAQSVGIQLSPDPWPEQALFTRSDHYSFVQQGVPSVFLVPGLTSVDPSVDGNKKFSGFLHNHYHKPTDDMNQDFNWQAATKFTQVNYQIGTILANQDNRPKWNEGDFFGDLFGRVPK